MGVTVSSRPMSESGEQRDRLKTLAEFLLHAEPILRSHLRRMRGRKHPLLSTNDLFGAVVHRMMGIETRADRPTDMDPDTRLRKRWALLMLVATRTVSDARRFVGRRSRNTPEPAVTPLPGFTDEELREMRARIDSLLNWLDPVDREIIGLRIRGQTWKVIAEEVGLGESACRQRWARLLKELQARHGN